ncbi:hypothetical protein [Mycobacterium uberis]|uniref:hypothetical protein n=1 Tax=Mycobacterium uberis TaxID=2162698 RepID=UPI000E2FFE34|nr:hypothetical protein [Mycobacterium uberis]
MTGTNRTAQQAKAIRIRILLGDHQDSAVSCEHLTHQTEATHVADKGSLILYSLLFQLEADLADRCRE